MPAPAKASMSARQDPCPQRGRHDARPRNRRNLGCLGCRLLTGLLPRAHLAEMLSSWRHLCFPIQLDPAQSLPTANLNPLYEDMSVDRLRSVRASDRDTKAQWTSAGLAQVWMPDCCKATGIRRKLEHAVFRRKRSFSASLRVKRSNPAVRPATAARKGWIATRLRRSR